MITTLILISTIIISRLHHLQAMWKLESSAARDFGVISGKRKRRWKLLYIFG